MRHMHDLRELTNPLIARSDNLRDPAVSRKGDEWHLFYTRFSNDDWNRAENWAVARLRTRDWIHFFDDRDITPKGFASPGEVVSFHDRYLLPFESYPEHPSGLYVSFSADKENWSEPAAILEEARELPWNSYGRAIDPTFVVENERIWCFFTASVPGGGGRGRANAIGLAYSTDPELSRWEIVSANGPIISPTPEIPDGVENLTVYRRKDHWEMLYSLGLKGQRIARMWSRDLIHWHDPTLIDLERQWWCERVQGAPCMIPDTDENTILLMGSDRHRRTRFGAAYRSADDEWRLLRAGPVLSEEKSQDVPF